MPHDRERVVLTRECQAIEIPSGRTIVLEKGMEATITQALGGTYTVFTGGGWLARIADKDADALGKTPQIPRAEAASASDGSLQELVWGQLRTCYDPEIPVNVVDLGLVYTCAVQAAPDGGSRVHIEMTLTAPGCGMGDVLKADAERKLRSLPGVRDVDVQIVVDPPWTPERMSEATRLQLGL